MQNKGRQEQGDAAQPKSASSSSCLSNLFPCLSSKATTESVRVRAPLPREQALRARPGSVYLTAAEDGCLDPEELRALKEFEDAVEECVSSENYQSVFFDASDHIKDDWEYLMEYMPATHANKHQRGSVTMSNPDTLLAVPSYEIAESVVRRRLSSIIGVLKQPDVKVDVPGYPGELNEDEVAACRKFRQELEQKESDTEVTNGKFYREVVDAFHSVEEEPYALCRFLRARKFDVNAAMVMVDEGVGIWANGREHKFYPDANVAIGNPLSVLRTQYPVIYHGIAKNGCPVSYFLAGQVSVEGLECVTTLEKLSCLAWHQMMYTFPKQIAKAQATNPDVVRCEAVSVIDLKGLKASALNVRTLEVLKSMATINKCFPEILNCMAIVNAPAFFSFSWSIIKKILDPRTAAKIKIFSNTQQGLAWIRSMIDEDQILSDYGGTGPCFDKVMQAEGGGIIAKRRIVELVSVHHGSRNSKCFEMTGDEIAELWVYTRSFHGCRAKVLKDGEILKAADVRGVASRAEEGVANLEPNRTKIMSGLKGPGKYEFLVESKAPNGNGKELEHVLLVGEVN